MGKEIIKRTVITECTKARSSRAAYRGIFWLCLGFLSILGP